MKILSAKQIRAADQYTIKNKPIKSIDLMENAASKCVDWLIQNPIENHSSFYVFCGKGNNGGDGLVIARLLNDLNFDVKCFVVHFTEKASDDFIQNLERLKNTSTKIYDINEVNDFLGEVPQSAILIDALLGTGITRPASGLVASIIKAMNGTQQPIVSIDLPSGLYADKAHQKSDIIIKAHITLSFQCPKLNFFLSDYAENVGEWCILDIGLMEEFISTQETQFYSLTCEYVKKALHKRKKFDHKGTYGKATIIAGEKGKFGAAVLSVKSCLRSGVGLCTAHLPEEGNDILQIGIPEAMTSINIGKKQLSPLKSYKEFTNTTIGIGPGIGTSNQTVQFFDDLLLHVEKPMVIDADALNILAENPHLWSKVPGKSILTPHPKEFSRIVGAMKDGHKNLVAQINFSKKHNCYIVLKGAYSSMTTPEGLVYFNTTGNPGMATGGSGDVLTGIITGLLAQGYTAEKAMLIGVYIHGLAGDLAQNELGYSAMIAGDIINYMGKAFLKL